MRKGSKIESSRKGVKFQCDCGWRGEVGKITDWEIEVDRDRAVRRCPNCGETKPEWGTFPFLKGVKKIAKGSLKKKIEEAGI
ncbi:hypothetical protein AKJ57_06655 [candidate division MSBL1 archaeon SCGC-AAA259A05]|uniref:Uncharacterized protein n=1 Tax=candidate division MSBL1 archaeon SCGC-AAA259A05 TaxID=1698259 RepID=A0A133U324_9EURY|nr:hypothetical protein AKJ57_06655 [candidate division MSBL1 archaeon SCGC-AAA259A05]